MKPQWKQWIGKLLAVVTPRRAGRRNRARPTLESLEERTLPSAFPFVQSINRTSPAGSLANSGSVAYTTTFSEPVTGVAPADFAVALTGSVAVTQIQVTPVSGAVYSVTVNGITGTGTLGLNLVDNGTIHDTAGNPLTQQNGQLAFQAQRTLAAAGNPRSVVIGDVNGDGEADLAVASYSSTVSVLLGNGNGTFQTQQTFATGSHPESVAMGDLNGDGKADLAVANRGSNNVGVLLGNGNGTFQSQQTYATGSNPIFVVLANVNGDGKPDLVVADNMSNSISVLLGNGNGTFQTQQTFATDSQPSVVAVADVNGDGNLDLVTANYISSTVSVLLGNGNGTFQAELPIVTGNRPVPVAVGDMNGDGKPDLVVGSLGTGSVGVLLGNGNGTFQSQQTFATGISPIFVALGDMNGDGHLDLVVANNGSNSVSVLLGNGNGTFQAQQTFPVGSGPFAVALGDLDGDSKPDIAVAGTNAQAVSVLLANTTGNFTGQVYTITPFAGYHFVFSGMPSATTAGTTFTFTLTALDQSNNTAAGYTGTVHFSTTDAGVSSSLPPDFTFASSDGGVHVFTAGGLLVTAGIQSISAFDTSLTDINGKATTTVNPAGAAYFAVAAGNMATTASTVNLTITARDAFNNVATNYGGTIHFSSTDAAAVLPPDSTLTGGVGSFSAMLKTVGIQLVTATDTLIAAITGNSKVITVIAAATHFAVSAPANVTAGSPFNVTVTALTLGNTTAFGYLGTVAFTTSDVLAAAPTSATLNGGAGIFSMILETAGAQTLTATDAVSTNITGISSIIAVRPGVATHFAVTGMPSNIIAGTSFNLTLKALDQFNNMVPGFSGVVQPTSTDNQAVLPATATVAGGTGTFSATLKTTGSQEITAASPANTSIFGQFSATFIGRYSLSAVACGDFNGDGKLDLAVVSSGTDGSGGGAAVPGNVIILLGNGDGTFSVGQTLSVGELAHSVVVGDFNGDGKLDLVVSSQVNPSLSVLLGNGNGTFVPAVNYYIGSIATNVVVGDFNGDGRPDLAVAVDYAGYVAVLLNIGGGMFGQPALYPIAGQPYSLGMGDFNHDGKLDLVCASYPANAVSLLLGNGDGTFQAYTTIATAPNPAMVSVGDFNGDGTSDLVVAYTSSDVISVLLGRGGGTFAAPTNYSLGAQPLSLATADINRDGLADIVVTCGAGSNSVAILLGNGNGTFANPEFVPAIVQPTAEASGDFNGDGLTDLAVVNNSLDTVSIILNQVITGTAEVLVSPQAATQYAVSAPINAVAGSPLSISVIAKDQFGNTATGYSGTVSFSSTDPRAVLPANGSMNNGFGSFRVTLQTPDNQIVTASDTVNGSLKGTSNAIKVGSTAAVPAQGIFASPSAFAVGNRPLFIGVGDFNSDGIPDLALAIGGISNSVSVLLGDGSGGFSGATNYTVADGPNSIAVGDFNGDGKLDIAVACNSLGNSTLSILLGNGNGSFSQAVNFNVGNGLRSIVTADFNGDGKADLACLNNGSNSLSLLLGNGNGTFSPPINYVIGNNPWALAVGDFNGDGKPDLAALFTTGVVAILLNNGGSGFAAQTNFSTSYNAYALAVGDFNGDGKLDLVDTYQDKWVAVLLGNGAGGFSAPTNFAVGNNCQSVAVGDFNGDGNLDMAVANISDDTVSLLLGDGKGGFSAATTIMIGNGPDFAVAADFNGDGKADLAIANLNGDDVSILLGSGASGLTSPISYVLGIPPQYLGADPQAVAVGDINGDGIPDLVVANSTSSNVSVLLGIGNGQFAAPVNYATASTHDAVAVGDFNGDGKLDFVEAGSNMNTLDLFLSNGAGFTDSVIYPARAAALAVGDFNGDGKLDLAFVNSYANILSILLGNGDGGFTSTTNYAVGLGPQALAIGDFNGDGHFDLAAANAGSNSITILLGNGQGGFSTPVNYSVGTLPEGVAVGDFNNDGKLDLAVVNNGSDNVSILLGNGAGGFSVAENYAVGDSPISLVAADFNGDGKVDLAVTNSGSNTVSLLLANGAGGFGPPDSFLAGNGASGIAKGDFDGNGGLDLAVAAPGGPTVDVLLNQAVATHFQITAPPIVTAGGAFNVTVQALDANNLPTSGYNGTVQFSSTDGIGSLFPATTLANGVGTFSVILDSSGLQRLFATDSINNGVGGSAAPIFVNPAAVNHFEISAQSLATPGSPITFAVTAQDQFYNTATNYQGSVRFVSSDNNATLPTNVTLTSGAGTFSATLQTAGNQTITAYDSVSTAITGRSGNIAVVASPTHFVISAPGGVSAGAAFVLTVTVLDQFNNIAANFGGTVHLTSSDVLATLGVNATLTAGVGFFAGVLRTAGSQTITATDTAGSSVTGTSAAIAVAGLAANHLAVTAPATTITASSLSFTVMALDQFGNVASNYSGTIHFSSSDANSVLPGNTTLGTGTGVFSVTLKTPGSQTITATDTDTVTNTITGTSNNVATLGLVVASLTPTPSGFVAVFNKPFDPSVINLYDSSGTFGPDDVLLTGPGAPQTSFRGSLIIDPTDTTITFVKTSTFTNAISSFDPQTGVLATGTYTVTFRSAANGFKDHLGALLDGTGTGNAPGSNYTTTFVVAPASPPVVVGIPGFARGPGDTVTLPNNQAGAGIPISLSAGSNVTSGRFTLQYNSTLLSILGTTVNSSLTGASLTLDTLSTPGNAIIDFTSSAPLTAGVVRLGGLVATVPNAAAASYKAKALLHFTSVQLNGGAIPATPDDAVEVVAYLGDVSGDGVLSGGDAALISHVATAVDDNPAAGIISGFAAFQLADPVLIGDITAAGNVNASDVTLVNSFLTGTSRPQLPPVPAGLAITPTGPDPTLSLGRTESMPFYAVPGSTIVVPVNIDTAHPEGSTGMTEAILALHFDPQIFAVSTSAIGLGLLPTGSTGWQLQATVNSLTGDIGIDLFGGAAIQNTASGSLVIISLHVLDSAPLGSTALVLVKKVNSTGNRVYQTLVADAQGALVLHTAQTSTGTEPGFPAYVTIAAPKSGPIEPMTHTKSRINGELASRTLVGADGNPLDSTQAAASGNPLVLADDLHWAWVQEVFGNLGILKIPDNITSQAAPLPLLDLDLNDTMPTSPNWADLALAHVFNQTEAAPDDKLEFLTQKDKANFPISY